MKSERVISRRRLLGAAGGALGLYPSLSLAAALHDAQVLGPRAARIPGRAKRLIFLFLTGGVSHVDTFDPKPHLAALQGKKLNDGFALGSPFPFQRYGQSGLELSELFAHVGAVADEL